jgi:hypothetical protein
MFAPPFHATQNTSRTGRFEWRESSEYLGCVDTIEAAHYSDFYAEAGPASSRQALELHRGVGIHPDHAELFEVFGQ